MSGVAMRDKSKSELENKIRGKVVTIVKMAMNLGKEARVLLKELEGGSLLVEAYPSGYGTTYYYGKGRRSCSYIVDYGGNMVELRSGFNTGY